MTFLSGLGGGDIIMRDTKTQINQLSPEECGTVWSDVMTLLHHASAELLVAGCRGGG